jgi:hypothetical protein
MAKRRHVNQLVNLNFKSVPTEEKTLGCKICCFFSIRVCKFQGQKKQLERFKSFRLFIQPSRLSAVHANVIKAACRHENYPGYLTISNLFLTSLTTYQVFLLLCNILLNLHTLVSCNDSSHEKIQCHFNRKTKKAQKQR